MKVNSYIKVNSLEEAYNLLLENPLNKILGGGLWLKKGNSQINVLIDLVNLGLDKIVDKGDYVEVGSLVCQRDFENNELIKNINNSILSKATSLIMGPAFRNTATIGGSIYGKYGFSDLLTALLVCDVTLVFYKTGNIKLEDYLNEKSNRRDILVSVLIKKESNKSFFKKVGITALDYPIINVAISKGSEYKIAVGSRAQVASLANDSIEFLKKSNDFDKASELISNLKFSDNLSAKADYRQHLAKVYVKRGLEEVNK